MTTVAEIKTENKAVKQYLLSARFLGCRKSRSRIGRPLQQTQVRTTSERTCPAEPRRGSATHKQTHISMLVVISIGDVVLLVAVSTVLLKHGLFLPCVTIVEVRRNSL